MKFSARDDIEAPAQEVWDRLTNFDAHARMAARRGVRSERLDGLSEPGPGMAWSVSLKFRGKPRFLTVELDVLDPTDRVVYDIDSASLSSRAELGLIALSPRRTRLFVGVEIKPKNLTGRLLLQSVRLIKPNLSKRFKARIADYGRILGGQPLSDI